MLFALRQPATLLGLLLGYCAGMLALTIVLRAATRGARPAGSRFSPRHWLDPFAAVGALLAGTGWAPRPELRRGFGTDPKRQVWTIAVLSVVVPGVLAAVGIAGYASDAGRTLLPFVSTSSVLHGSQGIAVSTAQRVALGFGIENLAIAVLSIVPIPPLATGVAVWSTFPRTPGSRRLAYHLLEEQWGVAAILVLLIIPLAGGLPALIALIATIGDAILGAL